MSIRAPALTAADHVVGDADHSAVDGCIDVGAGRRADVQDRRGRPVRSAEQVVGEPEPPVPSSRRAIRASRPAFA